MKKMLEALDKVTFGLTPQEKKIFDENRFPYLWSKAWLYLQMGPDIYRKRDAFGMPSAGLAPDELLLIENGCRQVLDGIGFLPGRPFSELGDKGFRLLVELFHFEITGRESLCAENGKVIYKIRLRHVMDGGEAVCYNLRV